MPMRRVFVGFDVKLYVYLCVNKVIVTKGKLLPLGMCIITINL